MEIPFHALSEGALRGLIEEFVTREGTEYGEREVDLETKCEQVRAQLRRGEAYISFDPDTETAMIHRRAD